ncbi:hypothetical protein MHK_002405 [Candidatus Magnetomorum sp. HK-1]|nr:hypothetical protein MHK_002405 [Candidatus Magnetomorum sp. HK-1]
MEPYPFQLVRYEPKGHIPNNSVLANRPFTKFDCSFKADARRFVPGKRLETAINTAISVGEPRSSALQRGNAVSTLQRRVFQKKLVHSFCVHATLERRSMHSHAGAWEQEFLRV